MKTCLQYIICTVCILTLTKTTQGQTFDLAPDSIGFLTNSAMVIENRGPQNMLLHQPEKSDSGLNAPQLASQSLSLKSVGAPLHPHIPTKFDIDISKVVGEIPLQQQVTTAGSMVYTVPVACAPGRQGVQSAISLTYTNTGGNGIVGQGWGIGGLSAIERTISSVYYDGVTRAKAMTADAKFRIDGNRMIQTSGTSTVKKFVPEHSNLRIEAYMAGVVTKYFKVWFPDGSVGIYGFETNIINQLTYPLSLMTDKSGNTIQYMYIASNSHYYIDQIRYGASKTISTNFATIKFTYKNRTDVIWGYDAGMEITEDKLLDKIECTYDDNNERTYQLTYNTNKAALLTQIDCTLRSGSLNPLKFFYGTGSPKTSFTKESSILSDWFGKDVPNLVVSKGRFDLWNEDDALIAYPNINPYREVYIPAGTLNHSQRYYVNDYHPNQVLLVYPGLNSNTIFASKFTAGDGFIELTSGDVDGKPGDELIQINNIVSGAADKITFRIYKRNGIGGYYTYKTTDFSHIPALDHRGKKSITPKTYCMGDFKGNGKLQVLAASIFNPLENGEASIVMLFDIDAGVLLQSGKMTGFVFKPGDILFGMDYDGDGKAEICHIHDNGTDIYNLGLKVATIGDLKKSTTVSRKLMVGDINGDGKTDLLVSPYASYFNTYYTNIPVSNPRFCPDCGTENPGLKCRKCQKNLPLSPTCYECSSSLNGGSCPQHGSHVYTQVNEYVDNGNIWTAYYAKGVNGFEKKTQPVIRHEQSWSGVASQYILQDINRDGRADLVCMSSGSIFVHLATGTGISATREPASSYTAGNAHLIPTVVAKQNYHTQLLALHNGNVDHFSFTRNDAREFMMSAAVNSFGVVTKTDYKPIDDKANIYTRGYGATFPYENFEGPVWVTSGEQVWNDDVKIVDNSYTYHNAVLHRQGLGFCGFERFTMCDHRNRTIVQTFDPLKYSILLKEETPVSQTENQYYTATNTDKTAVAYVTQQKVTDLLNNNTLTTTFSGHDIYYNPGKVETDFGGGIRHTVTYKYSNTNTAAQYLLGVPLEETNTATRDGTTWETKTIGQYNAAWLPLNTKTLANNLQTGYETYKYDTEGNLTNHTTKAFASANTMETKYEYDAGKRFVMKTTDPMGFVTSFVYDSYGRLEESTDFRQNKTTYAYDQLDRQHKVTSPDGVVSQTNSYWDSSANGSVFATTQTTTGSPDQTVYYDAPGRQTRSSIVGFNGTPVNTDYVYDGYGRLQKVSDPYQGGSPRYTASTFDTYDRTTQVSYPTGRTVTTTYSPNTVIVSDAGLRKTQVYDAAGTLLQVTDPAGTIRYVTRPDGQPKTITAPNNAVTTIEYDDYGRQTKMIDPSAGTIQYAYDNDGLLHKQINARNQVTEHLYNKYGQVLQKIDPEQTATYTYNTNYQLVSVSTVRKDSYSQKPHQTITYWYDNLGRVNRESNRDHYDKSFTFDKGRINEVKYNNYLTLGYEYNTYGYLYKKKIDNPMDEKLVDIYTINSTNHLGQVTSETYGNGVTTTRTYTDGGFLQTIKATKGSSILQHMSYAFDESGGVLTGRHDLKNNKNETFQYDAQKRLVSDGKITVAYNAMGSITSKTDAGTLGYEKTDNPYQVTSQRDYPADVAATFRWAQYRADGRTFQIQTRLPVGNGANATQHYGHDAKKIWTYLKLETGERLFRNHFNESEIRDDPENISLLYIGGNAYTASAVAIRKRQYDWVQFWRIYYIHRDHLGSIVGISDADGKLVEENSFNAWGRPRNPATHQYNDAPSLMLGRGFTGHEHLPQLGVINMNARLYDPVLGQFLSPDPYVQAPDFSQSFNRYAYCWNNPLMYTDEDGEWIHLLIGAIIGGTANLISNWKNINGNIGKGFAYFGVGAAVGTLSAAAGGWTAGASKALGVLPGMAVGGGSGAMIGAGSSYFLNGGNNLLAGGYFNSNWQSNALSGAIGGTVSGVIGGGIKGYKNAKSRGANLWTGNKTNSTRTFTTNPKAGVPLQANSEVGCYGSALEYADSGHGNRDAAYFMNLANNADGADAQIIAARVGLNVTNAGRPGNAAAYIRFGQALTSGEEVLGAFNSGSRSHWSNVIGITVSEKARIFGGGVRVVVSSQIWDPSVGFKSGPSSFLKLFTIRY